MAIVTKQQLIDAATDVDTLESVVSGAASPGTLTSRLGTSLRTVLKVIADLESEINTAGDGWLALAEDWATKVNGIISATDYSAKAWAIGGTGVTTTSGAGAAKEWATKTDAAVDTTSFSAKEYSQGTQASTGGSAKNWSQQTGADVTGASANSRSAKSWAQDANTGATLGGSAKDWAQTTGGAVDGSEYAAKEYAQGVTVATGSAKNWASKTSATVDGSLYSAKEYSQGTQASTGGSAKNWAQQAAADVTGASALSRSAKSWAQDDLAGATYGGSAKDWAQSSSLPNGTLKSAKSYAADAAVSAAAAAALNTLYTYGAVGDGTTDDTAALVAAQSYGRTIYITNGTFKITDNETITIDCIFTGGKLSVASGKTVALNGSISAPTSQIFSGSGVVTLGNCSVVKPEWWGALRDGSTDDSAAITKMVTCAKTGLYKEIDLSSGIYGISSTLDFNLLTVRGKGADWQNGNATKFLALTDDILMIKYTQFANLSNFSIDGNGKALWGLLSGSGTDNLNTRIQVVRCKEYGIILGQTQNSSFINCESSRNKYNWVFANGARNCSFYNCHSGTILGYDGAAATSAMRQVIFLTDTSNPHSFGLATTVDGNGNDRLNFFGGIFESFNSIADFCIETINNSGYSGLTALNLMFWGTEFDNSGGKILKTDSSFTGTFHLHNTSFSWKDQNTDFSEGTAGKIIFYGNAYLSGGANNGTGITQGNNALTGYVFKTSEIIGSPVSLRDYYQAGGACTISYNSTTKTFSVSGGSSGRGVGFWGPNFGQNSYVSTYTAINSAVKIQLPVAKITFTISNIVGGSGLIRLSAEMESPTFQTTIADYAAGTFTAFYKCISTSKGGFDFTLKDVTSFDVSNVSIEWL